MRGVLRFKQKTDAAKQRRSHGETDIVTRLPVPGIAALVLIGAMFGAYRYWLYEAPRATGPLAEALIARFDPDQRRRQVFNDVMADHIEPQAPLTERQAILESNGFDCVIRLAYVEGSTTLLCRRPIDGRRYCDRFNLFAYQSATGEIIESLVTTFRVPVDKRVFGR